MSLLKLANELDEFQEVTAPRELSPLEERYLENNNPTFSNKTIGLSSASIGAPLGVAAYVDGKHSHITDIQRAMPTNKLNALTKQDVKNARIKGLRSAGGWGGATALATGAAMLASNKSLKKKHNKEKDLIRSMSEADSHDFIDRTNGLAPRNDTLIIL